MRSGQLEKLTKQFFGPLVLAILALAFFLRVWQVDQPAQYIFDEDFHAFTALLMTENLGQAFEWWHPPFNQAQFAYTYRDPAIEWLHPPIAKYFQAASLASLGNNSFAWRLPSVLAGTIVVLLTILLSLELTKSHLLSLLAGSLVAIEHLQITQSRIAMNDIFVTLFILLCLLFFVKFFHSTRLIKFSKTEIKWLVLAGMVLGFATATKWSGGFLWLGLSAFWLIEFWIGKISLGLTVKSWLILSISAIVIYCLAFSPALIAGKSVADIWQLHHQIINYQTSANFSHPHQSQPWQWLINQKPVWYFFEELTDQEPWEITAQGSAPIILAGNLCLIFTIGYLILRGRGGSKNFGRQFHSFLLTTFSILALWLPWFLIARPKFFYLFTPIVPLLVILMILLVQLFQKRQATNLSHHVNN